MPLKGVLIPPSLPWRQGPPLLPKAHKEGLLGYSGCVSP